MENQPYIEKIAGLLQEYVTEADGLKYLSCKDAFTLAAKHDLKLSDLGTVCNLESVRINNCQLGCFK